MRPALALCAFLALAGCASADADELAVSLPVPARELRLQLGPRRLPAETLDAEVLRALEYWNPRVLEETLRPWAQACVHAAGADRGDAIWLASQASVETKFESDVLSYRCNGGGYVKCDHGAAVGPWQMHDRRMLRASPEVQAARALAWMRARPQAWTTWRAARAQADQWLGER